MAGERKFVKEKVNRTLVKEFLKKEIEGAGFGGLDIQRTPMGTRINMIVERPGLVIGRRGANINKLTEELSKKFGMDNPQIEIQEAGSAASLNAQIMAEKLAEALERGWHFRRAGHSTVRRIMEAGAKGCQIIITGKLTGARHRVEKFTQGHVKYCGEPAREVMDNGYAKAKKKLGMLGIKVRIMRPDARLPDEVNINQPTKEIKEEKAKVKEEKKEVKKTEEKKLTDISGVGPSLAKKFEKADIKSIKQLDDMALEDLAAIKGIGEKTAKKIKEKLKKMINEEL